MWAGSCWPLTLTPEAGAPSLPASKPAQASQASQAELPATCQRKCWGHGSSDPHPWGFRKAGDKEEAVGRGRRKGYSEGGRSQGEVTAWRGLGTC